jgi:hypothetical protein
VDLAANTGAVNIKAQKQLSLLGGNDGGSGGVLIESKTSAGTSVAGTGSAGSVGGVLVKSDSGIYLAGTDIGITASDADVLVSAENVIHLSAPSTVVLASQGMIVAHDVKGTSPGHGFFPSGMLTTAIDCQGQLNVLGSGFFGQSVASGGSVIGVSGVGQGKINNLDQIRDQLANVFTQESRTIAKLETSITAFLDQATPLNTALLAKLGFTFWTSQQLGTQAATAWYLPETLWQNMSRTGEHGATVAWTENPVISLAGDNLSTMAFPGYECWAINGASLRLTGAALYANLKTGGINIPSNPSQATLPADSFVSADTHFLVSAPNA